MKDACVIQRCDELEKNNGNFVVPEFAIIIVQKNCNYSQNNCLQNNCNYEVYRKYELGMEIIPGICISEFSEFLSHMYVYYYFKYLNKINPFSREYMLYGSAGYFNDYNVGNANNPFMVKVPKMDIQDMITQHFIRHELNMRAFETITDELQWTAGDETFKGSLSKLDEYMAQCESDSDCETDCDCDRCAYVPEGKYDSDDSRCGDSSSDSSDYTYNIVRMDEFTNEADRDAYILKLSEKNKSNDMLCASDKSECNSYESGDENDYIRECDDLHADAKRYDKMQMDIDDIDVLDIPLGILAFDYDD
jgi:hypothetical protein